MSKASRFYDELDIDGQDRKLPPRRTRGFVYEPNILSEELVRLQGFIHDHHQTVDRAIDQTVSVLFRVERAAIESFRWMREDAPKLVMPSLQIAAVSTAIYFYTRTRPIPARIAISSLFGTIAGLMLFPSWRHTLAHRTHNILLQPDAPPPLHHTVAFARNTYKSAVMALVTAWDSYDQLLGSIQARYQGVRGRLIAFFKPGRQSP